jgi:small-conductance mechanosensitive channel
MNILEQQYLGNSIEEWLIAAGVIIVTFVALKLTQRILVSRLGRLAERTKTDIDDAIVEVLGKTKFIFLAIVSVYASSYVVTLSPSATRLIHTILVFGFLTQGAIWGNTIIAFLLGRAVKKRMTEDAASATTLSALGFVSKLVLWAILLLLALDNLGVNITGLIAGLGIGGIAVALALQNILGDLFASLSIVLDKPFVIGDFIIVDEHLGTVEHIGLKTTRIRSLSGEQTVFSNADLLNSRIRNFKRMFERRVVFSIGVTYQTPHGKLAAIGAMLKEIIEGQPDVRFDRAHFKDYGDSSLNYEIVYYVKSPDYNRYMDIQQAINLEIYRRFGQEGIDFAYPTRTLFVEHTGEPNKTDATNS